MSKQSIGIGTIRTSLPLLSTVKTVPLSCSLSFSVVCVSLSLLLNNPGLGQHWAKFYPLWPRALVRQEPLDSIQGVGILLPNHFMGFMQP